MQPLPATAEVLHWLGDSGDVEVRRRVVWICEAATEIARDVHEIAVCFVDEDLTLMFTRASAERSLPSERVRSSLALSFGSGARVVATVTVYSDVTDAFLHDVRAIELHLGALPGRSALDADLHGDMRKRALLAPSQLRTQRDVDTAVGLLMGMDGLSAEQAEKWLGVMARTSGRTVEAVAAEMVAASGIFAGVDPPATERLQDQP